MDNQINERINIAKNFKSIYKWEGKSPEKKKRLKKVALLNYGILMVSLSLLIVASLLATIQIGIFFRNWNNAALLAAMTMAISIRAPFAYIEFQIQKHIKKIENTDIQFDKKINNEFDKIISKFNRRKKYIYLSGLPAILIFIPAFLQVFELNPYWEKFPPIVLAVSLYLFARINYDILKLKRNLK